VVHSMLEEHYVADRAGSRQLVTTQNSHQLLSG
jgi:hypothetical protein